MEFTFRRQREDLIADVTKDVQVDTSVLHATIPLRVLNGLPLDIHPFFSVKLKILTLLVRLLKRGPSPLIHSLQGLFRNALVNQLLTVDVSDRVHVLDDSVHQGLRVRWLIKLVVAHLAVANKVNDNITAELLAVLRSNAECVGDIVHRVRVNVENRSADGRGDFGAVSARTRAVRGRCEADLIVDDNMDGASDFIILKPLHLQALVHDTLSSDRSITVNYNGYGLLTILALSTQEVLLSANTALDARVDRFQM